MFNIFTAFNWLGKGKAEDMNMLTANDYYDRLKLIALSLFEWENLPPSCDARYLEMTLYLYGQAIFVFDETLGYLNMKCTPSGTLNHYDIPLNYTAVSTTYNKEFSKDDCILIRNNYIERPTDRSVVLFASRLTEAERTIDVNVKGQKTPYIVKCDNKDLLSMKNIIKQKDDNELTIFGSKSLNLDAIKVFPTLAPFVADKIQNYKHEIWNEALTFFGINNANSDKRERLITDEVNANNEVININAQAMLLTRLEACKLINEKYKLNVSVKMRCNEEKEQQEDEEEGVEE